jgi:hypothetical protein
LEEQTLKNDVEILHWLLLLDVSAQALLLLEEEEKKSRIFMCIPISFMKQRKKLIELKEKKNRKVKKREMT